jgi:opacity protein-like surface antigen
MYRPLSVFSSVAVFCSTFAIGAVASEEAQVADSTRQIIREILGERSGGVVKSDTRVFLYGGMSMLTSNPRDVGSVTYSGIAVGTGLVFAEHHRLTLETGMLLSGHVKGPMWREESIRYRYQQSMTIMPFILSYNYCTYFEDAGIGLRVGPLAGMFVSWDSSGLYSYDSDDKGYDSYEDKFLTPDWTRVHGHDKTDVFFGGGGELGLTWQFTEAVAFDLNYRFFYTSSHRIFETQSGPTSNHQLTLSLLVRF